MALTVASLRRSKSTSPLFVLPNLRIAAAVAGLAVIALAIIFIFVREPLTAELKANLGSVEETRAELPRYHFSDALVEFVRRDADLSKAESYFQQALGVDPENVTANQRLAQIALARNKYDDALRHLLAAQARDPENDITQELLAEAYLGAGKMDESFIYWSHISDAAARLRRLARVRFERNGDTARAKLALALADRIPPPGK
jgi:predicted Zn-dependent protease